MSKIFCETTLISCFANGRCDILLELKCFSAISKGGAGRMPRSSYFYRECLTCGRTLQVRVEYLGRTVTCPHCQGSCIATDPNGVDFPVGESGVDLIDQANALLDSVELRTARPR